ncbi:MAG: Lrp/AsnC ligand binding domain-containing protein [Armatimonadota bacterium]|nr:Lrp/AsnC ligand binding domain-containing protein [Armatimonadota bacterium]MDR7438351.1 Lrp/AsnC ligand binding domain-containing protein [Armatimonadota bacterium]MDR7443327.1 Lrp/AsnC ligand binding domain-containing protein [Armatimonadota bacterium]MDR7563383.1 Lrp/AsnC ligand binding domain-containing protein [Armatimonadota bacterium]MDR7567142.1 Lrp/AsnC ligand binding domain-containing protein [Armatimonadota bacterium]
MHIAFLLISLDGNTPAQAAREVRTIPGILEAHATLGEYDVVAIARAEHTREIPQITERVSRIHGVVKVLACVAVA